MDSYVVCMPG